MGTMTFYHLEPRGALHIGERGVGLEEAQVTAPSDTLYGALLATWVDLGKDPATWDRAFASAATAPFLLTSSFPRVGELRFYPVPKGGLKELEGHGVSPKRLKKVKYLSEGLFRRLLAGEHMKAWVPREDETRGVALQGDALWLERDEVDQLPTWVRQMGARYGGPLPRPIRALRYMRVWAYDCTPHVTVDRLSQAGDIRHEGRVVYAPECGLWFAVRYRDAGWKARMEMALTALADAGLGGRRSSGPGGFTWEQREGQSWPEPTVGDLVVTLSRYHPASSELPAALEGERVRYELVAVSGYCSSPGAQAQRRRRIRMIESGAVLRQSVEGPMGTVPDVRPEGYPHPVSRYGVAFAVGMGVSHGS